ncbi:hypothetical protein [Streptomyces sp. JB150]|uniref:hypothetical protein n=1 Tax=Streptomyces sp. JB150 TaxID=2714844 RepID=UPI00140DD3EF|nr:hypothetical protein [Streptomyces sp. JB150]QIJ64444.1 hypothetical protein G7Z13_22360 [Streptomyces sp. JB150]
MRTGPRAMRRLSARLVDGLRPLLAAEEVIPATARALSDVRGRPVHLRQAVFPPFTASGVWVDRTDHDLIVYEENTDPEHQLVIIGHEAWHMFQGHGHTGTATGDGAGEGDGDGDHAPAAPRAPRASRPAGRGPAATLAEFVAALAEATRTDLPPGARMDASLHFAARTEGHRVREELDAEHFGFRFATDVRAVLHEDRSPGDPHDLTGRIRASMAHRFQR